MWWQAGLVVIGLAIYSALGVFLMEWRIARIKEAFATRYSERLQDAQSIQESLIQGLQGLTISVHVAMEKLPEADKAKSDMEQILARAETFLSDSRGRAAAFAQAVTYRRENAIVSLE